MFEETVTNRIKFSSTDETFVGTNLKLNKDCRMLAYCVYVIHENN